MGRQWKVVASRPSFPPPAVVDKALELGPGSGPWSRSELAVRWGESSANKFIAEAKAAGWLVAPINNTFYVPPARDLVIVNWLSGVARQEFLLSRAMAAAGFRSWCFSSWSRALGIETAEALFVTDLGPLPPPRDGTAKASTLPPARTIADRNRDLANRLSALPFLENVVLAPWLPQSDRRGEETVVELPGVALKKPNLPNWILDPPNSAPYPANKITLPAPDIDARRIQFPLTPVVDDVAWAVALLAALGLPRFNERIKEVFRREAKREPLRSRLSNVPFAERIKNWTGIFAPPEPNSGWRTVFLSGRTQYLLVPQWMWEQSASLSNAQRFQDVAAMGSV